MRNRDQETFAPVPVTGGRTRRGAWLASAVLIVGLASAVGAGALGRVAQPGPTARPSPDATAASGPRATGSPDLRPSPSPATAAGSAVVAVPGAGYEVAYTADAAHQPVIDDNGALAVFGFGPLSRSGAHDGTISVAVGTPARPVTIPGDPGPGRTHATSLEDLRLAYLSGEPGRVLSRVTLEIDGQVAIMIRIDDALTGPRATALVVHGGRTFVLTATGFQGLFGNVADNPAQVGLQRFVDGLRFGPSLFVSRELGFQVPLPVEAKPFGLAADFPPDEAEGLSVFADGQMRGDGSWSHWVGVAVGSAAHPAFVRVLPSGNPRPRPMRIWAPTVQGLLSAYRAAVGGVGRTTDTVLSGEPAILVDQPDGLAATVLAVHRGRAYLITTTGSDRVQAAPAFERFLAGFAFLD